ncbi:MAG: glycosyltransferase family 4 protein [Ignavibacteria bacterium]
MINLAWVTSGFYSDENEFRGAAAIHNLAREISMNPEIQLTVFALYYPFEKNDYNLYNAKVFTFSNYPPEKLTSLRKLRIWQAFRKKFAEEHNRIKFDVIHSFWAGEPGYNASKVSQKFGIPLAANICGGELAAYPEINYGQQLSSLQRYFIGRTFFSADLIVCGSDFIADKASEFYDTSIVQKIRKIPFGVYESRFSEKLFPERSVSPRPVLVNIAHAVPVKAHADLLLALIEVKKQYPGIQLNIYGNDGKGFILHKARTMGLEENVKVFNFIEYNNIPLALHNADVFVLSSVYESQNMAMLEAAFMGLPVVSTDVGVAREITPFISKPRDTISLAQNIIKALKQPKPGYKNLHDRFSLKASAEQYFDLYKEISGKK